MLIINRVFIMVLLLSISGLIFSAVYLPLEKIVYKLTSARFMVFINTVALFTFVIPFYYTTSLYDGSEAAFTNYNVIIFEDTVASDRIISSIHSYLGVAISYVDVIWLLGTIIFLTVSIVKYIKLIEIVKSSFAIESDLWQKPFEKLKKTYKVDRIFIVVSNKMDTVCTVGLIDKHIIIPAYMLNIFDEKEAEFILRHEFCHAVRKDAPRKLLIIILNCLNWFNPMFYFLKENLSNWIEMACDEDALKDLDNYDRRKYGGLIIKVLEAQRDFGLDKQHYTAGFSGSTKNYQRRINRVMKSGEKKGFLGRVLVSSLALASIFTSSAIAKEADYPVNQVFSEKSMVYDSESFKKVSSENTDMVAAGIIFDEIDFETGNYKEFTVDSNNAASYQIIYNDGSKSSVIIGADAEPNHLHNLVDVVLSHHVKNSDGSCTTTYYEGKECTVCGLLWQGDVINVITQAKCTH